MNKLTTQNKNRTEQNLTEHREKYKLMENYNQHTLSNEMNEKNRTNEKIIVRSRKTTRNFQLKLRDASTTR